MRILVSGATGLVGAALTTHLSGAGREVVPLGRSSGAGRLCWDTLAADQLEGLDAVVHLAGESIAGRRWTRRQMARIRDSRVLPTARLSELLAATSRRPPVLVCASGAGYYGDRGDEVCTEDSDPGLGFLPETCIAWEGASTPARDAGIRVVHMRFGMVLSADGGALAKMLPPFRFGLGGRIGHGRQYVSWIGMADVVEALARALDDPDLDGPVNTVAPAPVTNAEFTRVLAGVLGRPAVFPAPASMLRLMLGRMANDLLLASTRVEPRRLLDRGFRFVQPDLESCLHALLPR